MFWNIIFGKFGRDITICGILGKEKGHKLESFWTLISAYLEGLVEKLSLSLVNLGKWYIWYKNWFHTFKMKYGNGSIFGAIGIVRSTSLVYKY